MDKVHLKVVSWEKYVNIKPEQFGLNLQEIIIHQLRTMFEGKIKKGRDGEKCYIDRIVDILSYEEFGTILQDGSMNLSVSFNVSVFQPKEGAVVDCVIFTMDERYLQFKAVDCPSVNILVQNIFFDGSNIQPLSNFECTKNAEGTNTYSILMESINFDEDEIVSIIVPPLRN